MADFYFHCLDFKPQVCLKIRREMTDIVVLFYFNGPVTYAAGLKMVCFTQRVAFSKLAFGRRGGSDTTVQILR